MKKPGKLGRNLAVGIVAAGMAVGSFVAVQLGDKPDPYTSPYAFGDPCVAANQTSVDIYGYVRPWHKEALLPLRAALRLAARISDYAPDINAGTYACRDIRGSDQQSLHSWPLAVDFDPPQNAMGVPTVLTELGDEPEFVKAWKRFFFRWGGDWTSRPDAMHFEYRGVPIPILADIVPTERLAWVPAALHGAFNHAGKVHGLDPRLLAAVAEVESGFDSQAVSSAGAVGIMQLMPFHCEDIDCTDPGPNIHRGARVLASYLSYCKGVVKCALAAYNVGPYQTDPAKIAHGYDYADKVLNIYWRKTGPVAQLRVLLADIGFDVYKRGPYRGIEVEAVVLIQQTYFFVKVDGKGVVGPATWVYLFNIVAAE